MTIRSLCLMIVLSLISSRAAAAPSQAPVGGGSESLGSKLLDDLAPPLPTPRGQAAERPTAQPPAAGAPQQAASPLVPLANIQWGMQNAQSLLAQPAAEGHIGAFKLAHSKQQDVVNQLDDLIAQLSKQCQCQGGQCDKPPGPNQAGKPKPGNKPSTTAGKSAARDSTDRLDRTSAKSVDAGDIENTVKELWGHLPERSREQMLQSFSDEFLPKYQTEIEQYYRRLSEDQKTDDHSGHADR